MCYTDGWKAHSIVLKVLRAEGKMRREHWQKVKRKINNVIFKSLPILGNGNRFTYYIILF